MARRKSAEGKTKMSAVQEILRDNPAIKPKEGVVLVKEKFNLDISPQMFSMYKSKKSNGAPKKKQRVAATDGPISFDELMKAHSMIKEFGSLKRLHDVVTALTQTQLQVG
ncbi:MAG: hypothetical protein SFX18_01495 [Pirellulales bacterium]|nr:hypothetical protein [Pirellulales bacterium]